MRPNNEDYANGVVILPDGKIVIRGSFGTNGVTRTRGNGVVVSAAAPGDDNDNAYSSVLQKDGKLVTSAARRGTTATTSSSRATGPEARRGA